MFFIASKLLTVFIDPMFLFFSLIVGLGVRYALSRWGRVFFVGSVLLLYCASAPVIVNPLFSQLEGHRTTASVVDQHFDAVVVLTGMVDLKLSGQGTVEFSTAVDRIIKGMEMIRENQADYLVISGGSGELIGPTLSEAKLLRDFVIRHGLPPEKILVDAESRNTRENALMTKVLLEVHHLTRIALVTSAFHMPRAMGCFRAVGLTPVPMAVDYQVSTPNEKDFRVYCPSAEAFMKFGTLVHELVGLVIYGLRGYAV